MYLCIYISYIDLQIAFRHPFIVQENCQSKAQFIACENCIHAVYTPSSDFASEFRMF